MKDVILEARGLVVHAGSAKSFGPWDCQVLRGERIVLRGESGCGKSSLLRTLGGLRAPRAGALRSPRIPEVIYLSQKPYFVSGTVRANLQLPFQFHAHHHRAFSEERLQTWLACIGLGPDLLDREARQLSGGEAQVVHLLRALQLEPKLLLLDEATSALDQDRVGKAEGLLLKWLDENPERAFLFISHDERQARRIGSRLWRLSDGRLDVGL